MIDKALIPELAERLSLRHRITFTDALLIVQSTRDFFVDNIHARNAISMRGFGSIRYSKILPYKARNPKTGEILTTPTKYVPHYTPSKQTTIIIEK